MNDSTVDRIPSIYTNSLPCVGADSTWLFYSLSAQGYRQHVGVPMWVFLQKTQHQCRHSHCSTAPERVLEQPLPCASEPETAKPAQFSAKPQCRYPLHPEKRVAATTTVKAAYQVQYSAAASRIDPGTQIDRPKAMENPGWRWWKGI